MSPPSCEPVASIRKGHSEAPNSSVPPGLLGLLRSRPGLCVLSSLHPWCPSAHPRLCTCPCSPPPPSLLFPPPDRPSHPPVPGRCPPSFRLTPLPASSMPLHLAPRLWLPQAHSMHSSCAHNFHLHAWCPSLVVSSPGSGVGFPFWEVRAHMGMQAHGLGDSEFLGLRIRPWSQTPGAASQPCHLLGLSLLICERGPRYYPLLGQAED